MSDTQPNPAEPTENQPGRRSATTTTVADTTPDPDEPVEEAAEPTEDQPGGGQ